MKEIKKNRNKIKIINVDSRLWDFIYFLGVENLNLHFY